MMPVLETARMILRPRRVEDAAQTQALFGQWEIVKELAAVVPWPFPEAGAMTFYRDVAVPAMERGEAWHWTLRLKDEAERIIGAISLMAPVPGVDTNRGFWTGLPWQGRGLMSEAAAAVTDYWFDTLGFERMRISKATGNAASRRISEKCGMRVVAVEEREYVSGRLPTEIWELTAAEGRARHQAEARSWSAAARRRCG
jgi:[ribosomal protein S5]-alanine N-acetyltransferase